jgi:hypothetical protein
MYEHALDDYACDYLIKYFEANVHRANPGVVVSGKNGDDGIHTDIKDSLDLLCQVDNENDWVVNNIIFQSLAMGMMEYKEQYDVIQGMQAWEPVPDYNIQRYLPGQGFKKYHFEHGLHNPYIILAWMFYLNDVEDGGTDFPYVNMQLNAKKGNLAIWPAGFTHLHAGIVSETTTKYIVTGWFHYENTFYAERRFTKNIVMDEPAWTQKVPPW